MGGTKKWKQKKFPFSCLCIEPYWSPPPSHQMMVSEENEEEAPFNYAVMRNDVLRGQGAVPGDSHQVDSEHA